MRFHILRTCPKDTSEYIVISDEDLEYIEPSCRQNDTKYLLIFIDGRITVPFFKQAIFYDNIFFYVRNFEYFLDKFEDFKDFRMVYHTPTDKFEHVKDPLDSYLYEDRNVIRNPPLFQTIITSLLRPDLYLSKDEKCKTVLETIREGKIPKECETIRSLILFGAVAKTEKGYKITFTY